VHAVAFYVTSNVTPCGVCHCLFIKGLKDFQVVRNEGRFLVVEKRYLV